MILLGVNSGFGGADCGRLPIAAIDFDEGIIDFPRPKTGVERRCPLWPETVKALREVLANRPNPCGEEAAALVFLTQRGASWYKDSTAQPLSRLFGLLLRKAGVNGRHRLGQYTLRHNCQTIGDEARDPLAVNCILGHEVPHTSSLYREGISDTRLRAVTDHIRVWLFPSAATIQTAEGGVA
jgi:integrase